MTTSLKFAIMKRQPTPKNMLNQTFRDLGFSENEIKIYLALLPLGKSPSSILGKRTGIQRSTAKYTCQQLVQKGLLNVIEKNGAFIYGAEPPERFFQKMEQQKKALELKQAKFARIMSEINTLRNPESVLPQVKFFEGREGYIEFCEHSLQCKSKEILFATDMDLFRNIVTPEYDENHYIPTRLNAKIKLRLLAVRSPLTEKMQSKDQEELRETRFLPKLFPIKNTLFLFDDVTTLISNEQFPSCVMIRSAEIAQMMRTFFEIMWGK